MHLSLEADSPLPPSIISAPLQTAIPHATCSVQLAAVLCYIFPWQFSSCSECGHPHLSHFHLRSTWVQVQETQTSVDDNMRRLWDAAKDKKEKTAGTLRNK
jgi:hypothetical protein